MTHGVKGVVSMLYGLGVIAGGVIRYMDTGGEAKAALWFGLVMGLLALVAGVLYRLGKYKVGFVLAMLTVLFVGGFFISQFPKGGNYASVRVMITIAASIVEGIILLIPAKAAAADAPTGASA